MALIKLIATDLDGTFLTSKERMPSLETKKAVKLAQQRGLVVCACTGRNRTELKSACEAGGLDDLCVMNNGASIINFRTGEYKLKRCFPKRHIEGILRALIEDAKNYPGVTLSVTGGFATHVWRGCCSDSIRRRFLDIHEKTPEDAGLFVIHDDMEKWMEAGAKDPQRINYFLPASEHGARMAALFAPFGGAVITTPKPERMEIAPFGTGKADGLQRLCELYGIGTENLLTIGDGPNDECMLRVAGLSVAMGNAAQSLKEMADAVTDSNDDEGFAKAIYRYALKMASPDGILR